MASEFIGLTTQGYETSVAGEDVKAKLLGRIDWDDDIIAKSVQVKTVGAIQLTINGRRYDMLENAVLNISDPVLTLATEDADVEIYMSFFFG